MSLPVPRIEDPWQQRKPVFIAFGIIGLALGIVWIWGGVTTGQAHPAHILRVLHDGPGPQPPAGAPTKSTAAEPPEIKLYGRVVDEFGAPIPNAEVRLTLRDSPGSSWNTIDRITSPDGRFSLDGQRANNLKVEVTKSGYHNVPFPSEGGPISTIEFPYGDERSLVKLHDAYTKPLVLTLWQPPRPTGPAVEQPFRKASLDPAGLPHEIKVRDLRGAPLHTIELRYWNSSSKKGGPRTGRNPYSWNATLFIHGGTIVEKDPAQVKPEAPATGYLPSISLDFPATLPTADWKREINRHYYIRFSDNTHGILTLGIDSTKHQLEGRLIRNPKPNDPDLTGTYLTK